MEANMTMVKTVEVCLARLGHMLVAGSISPRTARRNGNRLVLRGTRMGFVSVMARAVKMLRTLTVGS